MYGSYIHQHPKQFNIEQLDHATIDEIMYPPEYLEKGFTFVYDFKKTNHTSVHPWESLVGEWKKEQEKTECKKNERQTTNDKQIFYFLDGGTFIKIYDKRDSQNIKIILLNELERQVFLSCVNVISFTELQQRFIDVPEFELTAMLQSFEQSGLVFTEDNHYLCLPLRNYAKNTSQKNIECLVNISP
jgi:hypothetical protein